VSATESVITHTVAVCAKIIIVLITLAAAVSTVACPIVCNARAQATDGFVAVCEKKSAWGTNTGNIENKKNGH